MAVRRKRCAASVLCRVPMFGDEPVVEVDRAAGLEFDRVFLEDDAAAMLRHRVEGIRVGNHFFDHAGEVAGVFGFGELAGDAIAHQLRHTTNCE